MKEAIKKAIEGGFRKERTNWEVMVLDDRGSHHRADTMIRITNEEMWSDPLFWQCLGKSLGWKEMHMFGCEGYMDNAYCECEVGFPMEGWLLHWHRFIDHLAEGKSAEEFFNNLLK